MCYFDTGIIIPRPPATAVSSRSTDLRRRYSESDDRDNDRRMRRHLAGRYNVKAKWEKLLAEKEASWVSFASYTAANPPNFCGSLPILRPILQLYDSAMKTPDFSGYFCIKIVGKVVCYVRLRMALTLC